MVFSEDPASLTGGSRTSRTCRLVKGSCSVTADIAVAWFCTWWAWFFAQQLGSMPGMVYIGAPSPRCSLVGSRSLVRYQAFHTMGLTLPRLHSLATIAGDNITTALVEMLGRLGSMFRLRQRFYLSVATTGIHRSTSFATHAIRTFVVIHMIMMLLFCCQLPSRPSWSQINNKFTNSKLCVSDSLADQLRRVAQFRLAGWR